MFNEQQMDKEQIVDLKEQINYRANVFLGANQNTPSIHPPQLALFNENESLAIRVSAKSDEEAATRPHAGASANLCPPIDHAWKSPRNCPEHERTCTCGCRKYAIGKETSEQ